MNIHGLIPAGVAARASAVFVCACITMHAPIARAQTIARPFSRELYYTVAGSPTEPPVLKVVTVSGLDVGSSSLSNARTLTVFSPPQSVGGVANPGVGDLVFAPDGDLLVAGAANKLYKVRLPDGLGFSVQAATAPGGFLGAPTVMTLICDPAADKAWAFGAEPLASIVGLLPGPDANTPAELTGSETHNARLHSLVWAPGAVGLSGALGSSPRVLYTSIETSPSGIETHHLGRIDMDTLATSRLIVNLPAARSMVLDPFTGKLLLFGDHFISQFNPDPAIPRVEETLDLASIPGAENITIIDGTSDAEGRLFAVSADGRLIVIDYAQTRSIISNSTRIKVLELEPHEPDQSPVGLSSPGSIQGLAPLSGPGRAQLDYCIWDNGDFDGLNGQLSSTDTYTGAPMAADDFYLEPGSVYRIDTITALLATNSILPKARLTLFEDCDGLPGRQLATYESLRMVNTGRLSDQLPVYRAEFSLGGLNVSTDMASQTSGGGGRVLWVAVQGVALGLPDEEWYWCSASNLHPRGTSARFRSPTLGYPDWTPVDEFGCGCTDFAFNVIGERCKVLYNGGDLDLAAEPAGSLSQIASITDSARSADNFVLPPCAPADRIAAVRETVCYIRAYIYSNCNPVRGRFELYNNTCKSPPDPATATSPPTPLYSTPFARVTDLGFTALIDGESLSAYCVEAVNLDWNLPSGHDYWLSAVGDTNFGWRKRTYFAFGARCNAPCPVQFSPAMILGQGVSASTWQRLSVNNQPRDLAMLIAVRQPIPANASGASGNGSRPSCAADTDGSGTVTLQDLFDYITHWFEGCP